MTPQMILAGAIVTSIACAGVLAYNSLNGWGWFLFVGLMLGFVLGDMK